MKMQRIQYCNKGYYAYSIAVCFEHSIFVTLVTVTSHSIKENVISHTSLVLSLYPLLVLFWGLLAFHAYKIIKFKEGIEIFCSVKDIFNKLGQSPAAR
jgi:hypothetical protein